MVEILGLEKLTSAFGLQLLPQRMATIIGVPIAGKLLKMVKKGRKVIELFLNKLDRIIF